MKTKPWSLVILALLHILAPVGNFVFNALRSGRDFSTQWFHWSQVLPKYLLFSYVGLPILAGIFIFICRRWSYWAYLVCIGLIAASNLFSFWTHQSLSTFVAMFVLLAVDIIVVAYFIVPSVQKVYFDPRLRWWEAAPRYRFEHAGSVNGIPVTIKNLALGGLFFQSETSFAEGDMVQMNWTYQDYSIQDLSGKVVYKQPSAGGYGVRFEALPPVTKKTLEKILTTLKADGKIVTERLPGPEDSFGFWIKKLFTTGKGLFPRS